MKSEKLRRHRAKQCVNLVELIKNRQRNYECIFSGCSSYRRTIKRRDNIRMDSSGGLGLNISQNQNQFFLSNNLHTTQLFGRSSSSLISSISTNNDALPEQKHTVYKPESHAALTSCEFINNFDAVSSITLNETKIRQEKNYTKVTETHLGNEKKNSEILVHSNETTGILSPGTHNNTSKLPQLSPAPLNLSNESDEARPIKPQSVLQNQVNTFVLEHASSHEILADEEAGGDGYHNNSMIEIEITLHSSNHTNSEEVEQVEDVLELSE